jgi:Mimiviridae putative endonuclease 4
MNKYIPPIIGHNIGTTFGYVTTADRSVETGADAFQIFYRPTRSYRPFHRPESETLDLAARIKKYQKQMVVHSAHIINLCQPKDDYRHYDGVSIIIDDLNVSAQLGAMGVIIHMGNDPDKIGHDECKKNFIIGIKKSLADSDPNSILILENGAGCGNEVSTSLEELGAIRDGLTRSEKARVKYCLDTCHLFAAGYAIDDPIYLKIFEIEIERHLGWDNVVVVHLNDSKDPFDSHKDNHQDIGKGCMNFYGLMRFVDISARRKIPMILETPCNFYNDIQFNHKKQMQLIRDYHRLIHSSELFGPEIEIHSRTNSHKEVQKKKKELSRAAKAKQKTIKASKAKATKSRVKSK